MSSVPISREAFEHSSTGVTVFSISSSITPLFLGIVIGAISSDAVLVKDGVSENGFLRTWFHPFPTDRRRAFTLALRLSIGLLSHHRDETTPLLQNDFRNARLDLRSCFSMARRLQPTLSQGIPLSRFGMAYRMLPMSGLWNSVPRSRHWWLSRRSGPVRICGQG